MKRKKHIGYYKVLPIQWIECATCKNEFRFEKMYTRQRLDKRTDFSLKSEYCYCKECYLNWRAALKFLNERTETK